MREQSCNRCCIASGKETSATAVLQIGVQRGFIEVVQMDTASIHPSTEVGDQSNLLNRRRLCIPHLVEACCKALDVWLEGAGA